MNVVFLLASGGLLGFLIAFLTYRSRSQVLESHLRGLERDLAAVREEVKSAREENAKLREHAASLETELKLRRSEQEEKLAVVAQAKQEFREAFGTLAADALRNNNASFLEQAKSALGKFQSDAQGDLDLRKQAVEHLVAPIHEKLGDVDKHVRQLEDARSLAYGEL